MKKYWYIINVNQNSEHDLYEIVSVDNDLIYSFERLYNGKIIVMAAESLKEALIKMLDIIT